MSDLKLCSDRDDQTQLVSNAFCYAFYIIINVIFFSASFFLKVAT